MRLVRSLPSLLLLVVGALSLTGCPGGGVSAARSSGVVADGVRLDLDSVQTDERLTLLVQRELPGGPQGAACLLQIRLADGGVATLPGSVSSEDGAGEWSDQLPDAGGKDFAMAYRFEREPFQERLELGGAAQDLTKQRVFLIDLRAQPPQVTPLTIDLAPLIPEAVTGSTQLRALVDRLAREQAEFGAFLQKAP